jgi:hypothetical protein
MYSGLYVKGFKQLNFNKISPVRVPFFHSDGKKGVCEDANSLYSQPLRESANWGKNKQLNEERGTSIWVEAAVHENL